MTDPAPICREEALRGRMAQAHPRVAAWIGPRHRAGAVQTGPWWMTGAYWFLLALLAAGLVASITLNPVGLTAGAIQAALDALLSALASPTTNPTSYSSYTGSFSIVQSLGNGAFMAIGAYAAALLMLHLNWPLEFVFLAATVIAAAGGGIFGLAAARLRGPYLAGATLMLAVALPALADQYAGVFGGDQGLTTSITTPAFLGATFPPTRWLAWVTCACAMITLVLLANLDRSRIGRNWRAVRDDDVAAALDGINVAAARIRAFVVSATSAGLAGALLAIVTGLVAPGAFTITLSIALLTAAVIGGLGSLPGAVWWSLVIVLVPVYATDVATSHGLSSTVGANIPIAAYGLILILVMLAFPQGLQGAVVRLLGGFAHHQKEGTQ